MSGGNFNYADDRAMIEIFGYDAERGKIPNVFEDREISELIYDVFQLIHDYDWYVSGDTCKESYLYSKQEFKNKWLDNRGVRVKRIVDDSIERLKQELYETYSIKEDTR